MVLRPSLAILLAAALAGCLASVPSSGENKVAFAFAALSEDGSWVLVDHAGSGCIDVARHEWKVTGADAAERDVEPLAWDGAGQPRPGPAGWCPGERRALALADSVFVRLRVVSGGETVATVEQPLAATVTFVNEKFDSRILVSAAVSTADWNRLAIKADKEGTVALLGTTEGVAPPLPVDPTFRRLSNTTQGLLAGDYVDLCLTPGAYGPRTYAVVDVWSNTMLHQATFEDIRPCE